LPLQLYAASSLIALLLQTVNGVHNCPRFYVVTLAAKERSLIYRDIACLAVVAMHLVTLNKPRYFNMAERHHHHHHH
jgi:hypothetical protein